MTNVKKQPRAWLVFFSLGIQIGVLMYAAVKLGSHLDQKTQTDKPWWTLGLCVFALLSILKLIFNQTRKL